MQLLFKQKIERMGTQIEWH